MLRYQLYDCRAQEISIEKNQLFKSYVELQKITQGRKFQISFQCSDTVKEFNIAPLLLVSFVENAFKHVSNYTEKENTIKIQLDKEKKYISVSGL